MAIALQTGHQTATLTFPTEKAAGLLETLRTWFHQRRKYNQTVRELSSLSDESLADIGLSRPLVHITASRITYGG